MNTASKVKATDFWRGKEPCWEMRACPNSIRQECPAPRYREYPCWEIEGTYCKWDEWGALGSDTSVCRECYVYVKCGGGQSIEIKLWGQGIKLIRYTHYDQPVV